MRARARRAARNQGWEARRAAVLLAVSISTGRRGATAHGYARTAMEDWDAHVEREARRYRDGARARLPDRRSAPEAARRMANAAAGAGLACLMAERADEARSWFSRRRTRYRESYADAPPGSWGRPIGAVKMRLLGGDAAGAVEDARWALSLAPAGRESPIGRYAAALASLVLGDDDARPSSRDSPSGDRGSFPAARRRRARRPGCPGRSRLYADGFDRDAALVRGAAAVPGGRPRRRHRSRPGSLARPRGLEAALSSALFPASAGSDPLR